MQTHAQLQESIVHCVSQSEQNVMQPAITH